ncbi:DNA cytosine methyltransferase [Bacillus swezeyi]|uniref:DNA cytosine methyltransferase n=1 Tax=Bacillus swezeyi TaxID=1925020 RepID=UPI0039C6DFF5
MNTIDLFSGCGGMSAGFQNAGFSILKAYEIWEPAIQTYKLNFEHPVVKQDISNVKEVLTDLKKMDVDMVIGGPPCQDFSHAGKRIEGTQADLTMAYAQIIRNIKPKWFVMENVDRAQKSLAYSRARSYFKEANYGLTEIVLDASKCGVPQKRRRFFCIGKLEENDRFLESDLLSKLSFKPTTVRDFLGDEIKVEHYYRHPRNYNRRGVFSIDEPAPTIRGVNRPIPKGYPGHPKDTAPITEKVRPLTTLERARLQTFPKNFKWPATSKTTLEQMIGNAVPVKLAEFIGQTIKAYEKSEGKNNEPNYIKPISVF